ncbi:phosphonopyruvate decarboxylase-related protein [Desulfatibacillum aliphaticivorans]|uniref:Phosphonopyruvate decarboxylase-related protein n=1 Tax=Desulfatibacillum aliphaticivorans TaxID=218208 RepID=B8FBJ7_DESAL|nr:alkaline phosphatase family protein [Desulfatibacillum aliphaticivorans]ACL04750.1 phosphonopyruvate decarboxylase-related protein [Desulfatibacillum aliphaticivorans]
MAKTCILILLDGLGDRSYPDLGNKTPLEAAATPFLDLMASRGSCGDYHAGLAGQALPSENAHFAMFGYRPEEFPGRGFLEGLGWGLDMHPGEIALLTHLSHVSVSDGALILEEKRPGASVQEARELIEAVAFWQTGDIWFRFHHTKGVDGILSAGGPVSRFITDSDTMTPGGPLCAVRPWSTHASDPKAVNTAKALYEYLRFAHQRLDEHPINIKRKARGESPANAVVTQRAGAYSDVEPFHRRWGIRGLSISSGAVYHGLARFIGMDVIKDGDTDNPGEDLARRLDTALEKSGQYGLIHVHTKAPDEAAHKKDAGLKVQAIEALDKGLKKALANRLDDPDILIVVTSDHSTPSTGPLIHSGETVPLALLGQGVRVDQVKAFSEIACAQGALGQLRGREFLLTILNHLDLAKLHGTMDTPDDQPFWPGAREPFTI